MDTEQEIFLYVEDDAMSRDVMEVMLVDMLGYDGKYQVNIFENSENFLNRLESLPVKPTLFFLDIHMMPYTGFQMLAMLRQHPDYRETPVVALTASVMNEEVALLRESGFHSCIPKPIDQKTFPATLQRILSGERIWRIK